MSLYDILAGFIGNNQILLIFLGTFFFGDSVILSLAVLSAHGIISVPMLFLFGFLGTVVSDTLWFYLGLYIFDRKTYFKKQREKYHRMITFMNKLTGRRPFLFLLFVKFIYGTRIFFILYLSVQKMRYLTFIIFDMIGTIIWLSVMTSVGWLAGKGMTNLIPALKHSEYLLGFIILLIILNKLFTKWLENRMNK